MRPGERLGPYEVLSLVGSGGMGEVWKARDTRLDRTVAIKRSAQRFSDRFEREAHAIAALNHPHICTLYDVGPDYLVMEFVDGKPLRGPLPLKQALELGAQIADALHCAHSKGVVHRDLKPANILVTKSGIKLLDFGLAKMAVYAPLTDATVTIAEPLTKVNTILGTLQYMSPEQLEGKPADTRSDMFAFGLVLYEMISGKPAFQAESQASLIAAILKEEPAPLPSREPVTPPALDRLVRKCLAKDPDARWQSAADLRDELEWIAQSSSQAVTPAPVSRRGWMRWLPAMAALALAVVAFVFWQSSRTSGPPKWTGIQLGGPSVSCGPRLSPDGQLLAFRTMVDGLLQLAVMKPDVGSWTLLTRQRDLGWVDEVSWAPDGSRLYFDRRWGKPRGVYSIPPLGGESRLLLDDAWGPEALPDGSLIVAKTAPGGDYQLFHFWPESGRLEALPALVWRLCYHPGVRAFPDGKEILFYGIYTGGGDRRGSRHLYALDLTSRQARILAPTLTFKEQHPAALATAPDGKAALAFTLRGDLWDLVKVPRSGEKDYEVLLSLPVSTKPMYLDASRDGSVYLDTGLQPISIVRFSPSGGAPEEVPVPAANWVPALPLANGRFLVSATIAGKDRVLIGEPGGEVYPFLQTGEESTFPFAAVAEGQVALRIGLGAGRRLAVASLRDGRILRSLDINAASVESVAASPDGKTLYYSSEGAVWSVPAAGGAQPRRITEGNSVSLDPAGTFLYISQIGKDPPALVRVSTAGGPVEAIPIPPALYLTPDMLSPAAVDARGRILVETVSANSYWYGAAILDPNRKSGTPVNVIYSGDLWAPGWTADGRILALGARFNSSIWRFSQESPVKHK